MNEALRKMLDPDYEQRLSEREQRGIAIGEQRGIAIGEQRGIAIGEQRGIAISEQRAIKSLMKSMKWTLEQAMDALLIPADKRMQYENLR